MSIFLTIYRKRIKLQRDGLSALDTTKDSHLEANVRVTLKMLAASLKLSSTTVSRALAGYPDVSKATRQRVMEAAERMGYHPDPLARRLATGRTDTVGMVFPFLATEFGDSRWGEVIAGLSEALAEHNMDLSIIPVLPERELETYRRVIDGRRVDALVVAWAHVHDERIELLQKANFPFLSYGRTESAIPYPWFDFDNEAGAIAAVERLIAFGHRRIALIHAPLEHNYATQRHAGFLSALSSAGIEPDPTLIVSGLLSRLAGYKAMKKLLALAVPPTAVFADNNLAGIGALRAIGDCGMRVPEDISAIVYDGVSTDVPLPYAVTAVRQSTGAQTGRILAQHTLSLLAGTPVDEVHDLRQPVIEPGDTDGPPPVTLAPKARKRSKPVS